MKNIKKRKSAAREVAYIALAVALITVCAWITVPLGPVPFTLQTFAVCFVGATLGRRGVAAVFTYVLMGLIGIPVFSSFGSGVGALLGPTGGYLFGFVFAALLPALSRLLPVANEWARGAVYYAFMLLGLAVCYLFGTVWFVVLTGSAWGYALGLCVLPFLLPDAGKLAVAALLSVRLGKYVY